MTFSLTNSADSKVGSTSADTFDGSLNAQGNVTFQSFDRLDGGEGDDSLIALNINNLVASSTTLQNIENVEFVNSTANGTIDLSATSGVKTIVVNTPAAGGTHTVQGIASGISSVGVTGMTTNADSVTFGFQTAAVSGSTDALTLKLSSNSVASGSNVTVNVEPGTGSNGYETLTIESTGGANGSASTGSITINDGNSTTLTRVNITGSTTARLTFTPDTITTVDATGNTAGVVAKIASTANQAQTLTGGAGSDFFDLQTTFDLNDSVVGGAGTDTLQFDVAGPTFALTDTFKVSGIETLGLATTALNGTLDVSKFGSDVNTVRLNVALAADRSITKLAKDSTIEQLDATANTLTAVLANATGTADALTFNLRSSHTGGAADTDTFAGITAAGVETITIDSGYSQITGADHVGDANAITTLTATAMKTLNVKGTTALNVGTLGASVSLVDSTALTPTLTSTTAGEGGLTVTLGTSANVAATVNTGIGNDSITGGAGDETITTGSGVDVVDIGTNAGLDNVNLGAGNDVVIVAAANLGSTATTYDTIAGGDGTADVIRVSAAGTLVDAMFTNVTGFERLDAGINGITNTGSYAVNANLGSAAAAAFNNAVRIDQGAGANQAWNVNASSFSSSQTIDFRGASATAVQSDTIVGGSGNDKITGGVNSTTNGDVLTGGAGADIFFFRSRAEVIDASLTGAGTVATEMDRITDFSAGVDKIQLDTAANVFGTALTFASNATVTIASAVNSANRADLTALATAAETAFTGVASSATAVRAYVFSTGAEITTAAGLANKTFLIINDDTAAIAATDTWIDITGVVGTLSSADFVFGNLYA